MVLSLSLSSPLISHPSPTLSPQPPLMDLQLFILFIDYDYFSNLMFKLSMSGYWAPLSVSRCHSHDYFVIVVVVWSFLSCSENFYTLDS